MIKVTTAVSRYNREHRREIPRNGPCPICCRDAKRLSKRCFGRHPDNADRWICHSSHHPEDMGRRSKAGNMCGDQLDLDLAADGIVPTKAARTARLKALGLLKSHLDKWRQPRRRSRPVKPVLVVPLTIPSFSSSTPVEPPPVELPDPVSDPADDEFDPAEEDIFPSPGDEEEADEEEADEEEADEEEADEFEADEEEADEEEADEDEEDGFDDEAFDDEFEDDPEALAEDLTERAAILEFEAGLDRADAEQAAADQLAAAFRRGDYGATPSDWLPRITAALREHNLAAVRWRVTTNLRE